MFRVFSQRFSLHCLSNPDHASAHTHTPAHTQAHAVTCTHTQTHTCGDVCRHRHTLTHKAHRITLMHVLTHMLTCSHTCAHTQCHMYTCVRRMCLHIPPHNTGTQTHLLTHKAQSHTQVSQTHLTHTCSQHRHTQTHACGDTCVDTDIC